MYMLARPHTKIICLIEERALAALQLFLEEARELFELITKIGTEGSSIISVLDFEEPLHLYLLQNKKLTTKTDTC